MKEGHRRQPILLAYISLKEALAKPGCPICTLNQEAARRYLSGFLWENVNDVGFRADLHRSWGFCGEHARLLQEVELEEYGDGLGTAIICEDLLQHAIEILSRQAAGPAGGRGKGLPTRLRPGFSRLARELSQAFQPTGRCPACASVTQNEEIYLHELLGHLEEQEPRLALERCGGLCLPHFLHAVRLAGSEDELAWLLEVELAQLRGLVEELREYIRKHDYRFAQEPKGAEQTSWQRALAKLVGSGRGKSS